MPVFIVSGFDTNFTHFHRFGNGQLSLEVFLVKEKYKWRQSARMYPGFLA